MRTHTFRGQGHSIDSHVRKSQDITAAWHYHDSLLLPPAGVGGGRALWWWSEDTTPPNEVAADYL